MVNVPTMLCQLHSEGNMKKYVELSGNVAKREESYVPTPTWRTMAVLLLLCCGIAVLRPVLPIVRFSNG
jgi:hypothetical protein